MQPEGLWEPSRWPELPPEGWVPAAAHPPTPLLPRQGHSAIATSEWAGAPLHEVLLAAGVMPEAKFIHFRHELRRLVGTASGSTAASV